jgi:hypothetical protein
MFKLLFIVSFSMCLFFSTVASCKNEKKYSSGGPYYYKDWVSYTIPYKPYNEVTMEEAKTLNSYYEAYFDNNGKIILFTKYLNGEIEWSDKYFYTPDGLLGHREMTKANGEMQVQYFDKKGLIIREEKKEK